MPIVPPPRQSAIAAAHAGLITYLTQETGFAWTWYKSWVDQEDTPKGCVFFTRSAGRTGLNYAALTHDVTLQILLAGDNPNTVQQQMLDWAEAIIKSFDTLRRTGLSVPLGSGTLSGVFMGCQLSTSGIEYYLVDSDTRTDLPAGTSLGTVRLRGEFILEIPSNVIPLV